MTDLRKQVEELLAVCEQDSQRDYQATGKLMAAFPAIARHYLALLEVVKMARRFAAYTHVLEVLAGEDARLGSTNGWSDLDPVLGAKGQLLTMGNFRLLRDALARADALEKP